MTEAQKPRLAALLFPGLNMLDLYGALEMLSGAYEISLVAETSAPVAAQPGPRMVPDATFNDAFDYDALLVPGGFGTRREVENAVLLNWLAASAAKAGLVASVCTGSALLARAGVLDGKRATSNKRAFAWVRSQGPAVDWVAKARWVEDGKFFTSSGVAAGMDMALAVVARVAGEDFAQTNADNIEYRWSKDASDDPFAAIHGAV